MADAERREEITDLYLRLGADVTITSDTNVTITRLLLHPAGAGVVGEGGVGAGHTLLQRGGRVLHPGDRGLLEHQSQVSIALRGSIRGQYFNMLTNQRLVLNCMDQSDISIAII